MTLGTPRRYPPSSHVADVTAVSFTGGGRPWASRSGSAPGTSPSSGARRSPVLTAPARSPACRWLHPSRSRWGRRGSRGATVGSRASSPRRLRRGTQCASSSRMARTHRGAACIRITPSASLPSTTSVRSIRPLVHISGLSAKTSVHLLIATRADVELDVVARQLVADRAPPGCELVRIGERPVDAVAGVDDVCQREWIRCVVHCCSPRCGRRVRSKVSVRSASTSVPSSWRPRVVEDGRVAPPEPGSCCEAMSPRWRGRQGRLRGAPPAVLAPRDVDARSSTFRRPRDRGEAYGVGRGKLGDGGFPMSRGFSMIPRRVGSASAPKSASRSSDVLSNTSFNMMVNRSRS